MICPETGAWRAWIDGESPQGPKLADHLQHCVACQDTVAHLQETADVVGPAIRSLAPVALPTTIESRHARMQIERRIHEVESWPEITDLRRAGTRGSTMSRTMPLARLRWAVSGLAAALVLTFFIATPDGRSAAAAFLAQFRSQRFTVVTVDPSTVQNPLEYLDRLGTIQGAHRPSQLERVSSVTEASQHVGFAVRTPNQDTLPAALRTDPEVRVSQASEMRFTFVAAEARAYLDSIGQGSFVIPERFDGASLVVAAPPAVLLQYATADHSAGLMIGQSRELTVSAEGGVTLDEFRDFLLSMPGLPPDTVRQLRAIQDWRNTLPIPVPVDQIRWQETTISGTQGLMLAETSGLGNAAIWQSGGTIFGLAGTITADELRRVADSLR